MPIYIIEFADEALQRVFDTDNEAINFADAVTNGWYEFTIFKHTYYEDNLAYGYFWQLLYTYKV
jgi:hypothetical protein